MRIVIAAVGRMKAGPERELVARYCERAAGMGRQVGLSGFETLEVPESRAANAAARKAEEARALGAAIPGDAVVVALDERARGLSSSEFADRIAGWRDTGTKTLAFVIGGADGLDAGFRKAAAAGIAFSPLTWPHQLVRIMLAEQLYRTTTILAGHPYHREG